MKNLFLLQSIVLLLVVNTTYAQNVQQKVFTDQANYLEYLPPNYNPSGTEVYPLIVFLHGCGEIAYYSNCQSSTYNNTTTASDQLNRLFNTRSIPTVVRDEVDAGGKMCFTDSAGKEHCFIIISPQLSNGGIFSGAKSWHPDKVDAFIEFLKDRYKVDRSRIYLTGLSLGGFGTWNYATQYPEKLAAIVPMSGGSDYASLACNLAKTPIWAFHDDPDSTVSASKTKNIVASINACPGKVTPQTTYFYNIDSAGQKVAKHSIWTEAYKINPQWTSTSRRNVSQSPSTFPNGFSIYEWLVEKKRSSVATTRAIPGKINAETFNAKHPGVAVYNNTYVGSLNNEEWVEYNVNVKTTGTYTFAFRIATIHSGQSFEVMDNGVALGLVQVPNTQGWESWKNITANFNLTAGAHVIRITSKSGEGWNLDFIESMRGTEVLPGLIEAEKYNISERVSIKTAASGYKYVGDINFNDWMEYKVYVKDSRTYTLNFQIATPHNNQSFEVLVDGVKKATVPILSSGGWETWRNVSASIQLSSGVRTITILSKTGSGWNLRRWGDQMPSARIGEEEQIVGENKPLEIYPNPAASELKLDYTADKDSRVQLGLIDAQGTLKLNKTFQVTKGKNSLKFSVANLPQGNYILEITDGAKVHRRQHVLIVP